MDFKLDYGDTYLSVTLIPLVAIFTHESYSEPKLYSINAWYTTKYNQLVIDFEDGDIITYDIWHEPKTLIDGF